MLHVTPAKDLKYARRRFAEVCVQVDVVVSEVTDHESGKERPHHDLTQHEPQHSQRRKGDTQRDGHRSNETVELRRVVVGLMNDVVVLPNGPDGGT